MKKRITAVLLAMALMIGIGATASAAEINPCSGLVKEISLYASKYLSTYSVALEADGNRQMTIGYAVIGTRDMDKIGVDEMLIEYWNGQGWDEYMTVSSSNHPEFYTKNDSSHADTYSFTGMKNMTYRVTLTVYAGVGGGSDTREITSYEVKCV